MAIARGKILAREAEDKNLDTLLGRVETDARRLGEQLSEQTLGAEGVLPGG
jgi:hypothetical protein